MTTMETYPVQQSIRRLLTDPGELEPAEVTVLEAVSRSCGRLLDTWPGRAAGAATELGVSHKADGSVVTAADLASEKILVEALHEAYPGSTVVTEEDETTHGLVDATVWLVDPLDGTSGYVTGSTDFAVLVSGWRGPEAIFSVAAFPAADVVAVARGPRLVQFAEPVRASDRRPSVHAVYQDPPGLRDHLGPDVEYALNTYESTRLMVEVARGIIDVAVVWMCGHQSWDLAAPAHLVEAGGGIVTDERGNRLDLTRPAVTARYVVASRQRDVHRRVLRGLQQHEEELA